MQPYVLAGEDLQLPDRAARYRLAASRHSASLLSAWKPPAACQLEPAVEFLPLAERDVRPSRAGSSDKSTLQPTTPPPMTSA